MTLQRFVSEKYHDRKNSIILFYIGSSEYPTFLLMGIDLLMCFIYEKEAELNQQVVIW